MADDVAVVPDPTFRSRSKSKSPHASHDKRSRGPNYWLGAGLLPLTLVPISYLSSKGRRAALSWFPMVRPSLSVVVVVVYPPPSLTTKSQQSILETMRPENEDDNAESPNTPIQKRKRSRAGCYTCRRRKVSWHLRGGRGLLERSGKRLEAAIHIHAPCLSKRPRRIMNLADLFTEGLRQLASSMRIMVRSFLVATHDSSSAASTQSCPLVCLPAPASPTLDLLRHEYSR